MIQFILDLLVNAQSVNLDGKEVMVWSRPLTGQPGQRVVQLTEDDSDNFLTALTEGNLAGAKYDEAKQTVELDDYEGASLVLTLVPAAQAMSYVLVQEGGTSAELYLHAHESLEHAEADRESCEEDGAYRTTDILEIPSRLADRPGFYEHAESLLRLMPTMGFPSTT
ncbi:hypothetical protein G3A43_07155 [Paraburkholderia aspalathi]|nr:hypothetical protein [Paraburkholderia aspalathi]MBK3780030.1 hypothetical protein [Paraburkholderia aspalathi]